MIRLFKQIFHLKFFIILIVMQCSIALLYTNTVSIAVDNYFHSQKIIDNTIELDQIVFYDEITDYDIYTKFINDLKNRDVEVYIYEIDYSYSDEIDYSYSDEIDYSYSVSILEIKIDPNYAKKLSESNLIKIKQDKVSCQEVRIGHDVYNCSETDIIIIEEQEISSIVYDYGITASHLFEYDGDLHTIVEESLNSLDYNIYFEVVSSNESNEIKSEVLGFMASMERQNIIAIVAIIMLQITLVSYHFIRIRHRSIAILSLLGYSRLKILACFVLIFASSVIPVYLILNLYSVEMIKLYVTLNVLVMFITFTAMFLTIQNGLEMKARERI